MISLIMLGSVINYLTRSTLSVAAPTMLKELNIGEREYSWIVGAFQGAIMTQPICGYIMDVLGLKFGFALFAIAWSLMNMAHSLASSWPALMGLRGLLGFAEGSANPAGMKATAEWFPAKSAASQEAFTISEHLWIDACASVGRVGDPHLQLASGVHHHWRPRISVGRALAVALRLPGQAPPTLRRGTHLHCCWAGEAPSRMTARSRLLRRSSANEISGESRYPGFWPTQPGARSACGSPSISPMSEEWT